jgi:Ni/Fe-hydrogenase subunit HybB-like protein
VRTTPADSFVIPALPVARLWPLGRTLALLAVLSIGMGIMLLRFVYGIGAVSNLNDSMPWGIWIGFDVMSGVALAAGAFVIAGAVHILRIERFEPLVRPAVLTGLLGYLLVIAGLMVDLGRPYNVWRPLIHWQYHSPLWEVGCCVATYTTVLLIEFLPVILERVNKFDAVTRRLPTVAFYRVLRRIGIVFVVLGVVLSTLHQSSLGSLWVLVPGKLHALWYTLYLPAFFWLSAVAVGLAMTIVESTLSSKAFKRGLELHLLADLARAASVVLVIYLLAKAVDLVARGAWPLLFQPSIEAAAYWTEIGLGVILPAILFALAPVRRRPWLLFSAALMVVLFGVVMNRLNVSIVGLVAANGGVYVPSWMEVMVSVALVTLGVIAFGLAAKYLPLFPQDEKHAH